MLNSESTGEYCARVIERLESARFRVSRGVRFGECAFTLAAKKAAFRVERYGFLEIHFVFAEFENVDQKTLGDYSKACFSYACRNPRIPLPRCAHHQLDCYSVVLTNHVDASLSRAVRNTEPPRHLGGAEIPVICDLATGRLHYLERTPVWGAAYWNDRWDTIVRTLAPRPGEP